MKYTRITEDGFGKVKLIPESTNIFNIIKDDNNKPWFYSTYRYNDNHKKQFDSTNSVAGIRDVTTNMIWFDFDAKKLEDAQKSTISLIDRLLDHGLRENNIKINYSGNKGFHVVIDTTEELTPIQVEYIANKFAGDLKGFDITMYDANQVLRIPLTLHEKSKVYCCPITIDELRNLNISELKTIASNVDEFDIITYMDYYIPYTLGDHLMNEVNNLKITEKEYDNKTSDDYTFDISTIDMSKKPRYIDEARWLLVNGFFRGSGSSDSGERNSALLCLAATYKNLGYDRSLVKGLLQGVIDVQAQRTNESPFPEYELERNILDQVFSPLWNNGQFSLLNTNSWLYKYATKMGVSPESDDNIVTIGDVKDQFINFVKNIEHNTVKTGIKSLDEKLPITIGTNLGLVGAAGAGKTALALKILENTSKSGVLSVFASLDMTRTRIFEKLAYRVSNVDRKTLYHKIKLNEADYIFKKINDEYKNVWFYDRSSPSVEDLRRYILNVEKKTGQKVKLLLVDYFERIGSDISDDTASSKKVAGQLQDLMNDLNIAIITMCQPNKFSLGSGPDTEIKSYTAIKGSSFLYQSFRGIIGISRPFYTPELKEFDKYMTLNILKNDLGELDKLYYNWDGRRGDITELEDIQRKELTDLLKMKEMIKKGEENDGWN